MIKNVLAIPAEILLYHTLYHLFASQELLALQLVTNHNIFFMNQMMKEIRTSISKMILKIKKRMVGGLIF